LTTVKTYFSALREGIDKSRTSLTWERLWLTL